MIIKTLAFLSLLFIPMLSFSQNREAYMRVEDPREASVLTVFSENRIPFFLVVNGIPQNNIPQTRVRIEGLMQYEADIQISFTDNTPPLQRRVVIADPVEGKAASMVIAVKQDRDGNPRLKFVSLTTLDHNYHAAQDEYVASYSAQQQPQQGSASISFNTAPPSAPTVPTAMDPQTFSDAKNSIAASSFDETKLSTAKAVLSANYISTDQVIEICRLFSFNNSKVSFAKFAYARTVDQNNYYKVGNVFDFDSDRKELNDFISRGGK